MARSSSFTITKASGQKEAFSSEKLLASLQKSGASKELAEKILDKVLPHLYEDISTGKIYRLAYKLLKKETKPVAGRYQLKRAIMELGPSGYPFEKFVSEILRHQGYHTRVGEIVQGKCVSHEIDVIAEKELHHFMIECKYHNHPGIFCDVKIPLYIQARFKDVEAAWTEIAGHKDKFYQGWVVTNTKFSSDAIQYASCVGLNLVGWDYPANNSLKKQIDDLGLYPVTTLTTLTKHEKRELLDKSIVLCKEICQSEFILKEIGVKPPRLQTVMDECNRLCQKLRENNHL